MLQKCDSFMDINHSNFNILRDLYYAHSNTHGRYEKESIPRKGVNDIYWKTIDKQNIKTTQQSMARHLHKSAHVRINYICLSMSLYTPTTQSTIWKLMLVHITEKIYLTIRNEL